MSSIQHIISVFATNRRGRIARRGCGGQRHGDRGLGAGPLAYQGVGEKPLRLVPLDGSGWGLVELADEAALYARLAGEGITVGGGRENAVERPVLSGGGQRAADSEGSHGR